MKLSREILSRAFQQIAAEDKDFQLTSEIVRQNSSGKIWLIGGFLYKNLTHILYNFGRSAKDFDFIVEKANPHTILPEGWQQETNTFGNPKLFNKGLKIDFIPLEGVYYIRKNRLKPCIANYFAGAPFNIHCLAYDIKEQKVIGIAGIKALEERVVRAHNLEMLEYGARMYQTTPNDMIRKKASELGFKAELI